jgi:hypothetical protein
MAAPGLYCDATEFGWVGLRKIAAATTSRHVLRSWNYE